MRRLVIDVRGGGLPMQQEERLAIELCGPAMVARCLRFFCKLPELGCPEKNR
jgi:hypothetical protein